MMGKGLVFFCILFGASVFANIATDNDDLISDNSVSDESMISEESSAIPYEILGNCPSSTYVCGFLVYDRDTGETRDIIKYCKCPEHTRCVKAGENRKMRFFYYRCKENLVDGDEKIPFHFTKPDAQLRQVTYIKSPFIQNAHDTEATEDPFYSAIKELGMTTESLEVMIKDLYAEGTPDEAADEFCFKDSYEGDQPLGTKDAKCKKYAQEFNLATPTKVVKVDSDKLEKVPYRRDEL